MAGRPDQQARLGPPPVVLLAPAVLAVAFLTLPLLALGWRTPWARVPELLSAPDVLPALGITLTTSLAATAICLVVGTPTAWVLARVDFPGRALVRTLVAVPLILPPVVAGVALLSALGRTGVLGAPLAAATGLTVPYTTLGVVVAHAFVAMPFYVIACEGALRAQGPSFDVVAASLGAGRWYAFRRVTLPMALPGIAAAALLAWARSLGEFGATITFAGNYPGTTQTMPSLIYTALQADPDLARVLSLVLLAVSLGILVLLRERWLVAR